MVFDHRDGFQRKIVEILMGCFLRHSGEKGSVRKNKYYFMYFTFSLYVIFKDFNDNLVPEKETSASFTHNP